LQKTDVLISGAGPAGLILSIDLSRRGIKHILLNDRPEPSGIPKLDIANTRTMEILRRLDVIEAVREVGLPTDRPTRSTFKTSLSAKPILSLEPGFSDTPLVPYSSVDEFNRCIHQYNDGTLPLENNGIVSQMYLEPVLKKHAEQYPEADVRFNHSFVDFEEHSDGINAAVKDNVSGETYQVEAGYLVACDGAQSQIRSKLGIALEGQGQIGEMTSYFLKSEDITNADPLGPPWHCWLTNPELASMVISLNFEKDYFNVHVFGCHENTEETLLKVFGKPFEYELLKETHWFVNLLVAESYGTERVFLAGDSAHQYFPTYGFGYNTAVLDVTNLAWKLAARIQDWGGDTLLASYEQEQLSLGKTRRDYSGKGAQMVMTWQSMVKPDIFSNSGAGEQHRQELVQTIAATHPPLYESLGLELGFRYKSDVVITDGSPEPLSEEKDYLPTTWPGSRLPHVFLENGDAIFDRLGLGFTLIINGEDSDPTVKKFINAAVLKKVPLKTLTIDEAWIHELYEKKYILVRPDQHIAWRGDAIPATPDDLLNQVVGKNRLSKP
jgi:2-polyprenyl-6-methoxyphenol hydroxylase-like FAD-dependent oxidoreductase